MGWASMLESSPVAWISCPGVVILGILYYILASVRRNKLLFPGPPGLPFFGNIFQLRKNEPWLQLSEWGKQYGSLFSMTILGQKVIVINDRDTAVDLLVIKSNIYSDRPRCIMTYELLTDEKNIAFARYGDYWRRIRKAGHEGFNVHAVKEYTTILERSAARLALQLIQSPSDKDAIIKRAASSTILSVLYGWPPLDSSKDDLVQHINEHAQRLASESVPGARLVELLPWLLYLPDCLAPWKKWAKTIERQDTEMFEGILRGTQDSEGSGDTFAGSALERREKLGLSYKDVTWLCGSLFAAGSETSAATMQVFLLAMVLYPKTMERAQAQIDEVVGRTRVPTLADESQLPYVGAIVREILRWRPAAPLGLPRRAMQDDWYNGYVIPKGTTIQANIWAINHDNSRYDKPDEFRPERYLDENGSLFKASPQEPGHVSFGFGRRICLGKEFVNQNLFINVAMTLWASNISQAVNDHGDNISPSATDFVNNGVVVQPAPFVCHVSPRSPSALTLLAEDEGVA